MDETMLCAHPKAIIGVDGNGGDGFHRQAIPSPYGPPRTVYIPDAQAEGRAGPECTAAVDGNRSDLGGQGSTHTVLGVKLKLVAGQAIKAPVGGEPDILGIFGTVENAQARFGFQCFPMSRQTGAPIDTQAHGNPGRKEAVGYGFGRGRGCPRAGVDGKGLVARSQYQRIFLQGYRVNGGQWNGVWHGPADMFFKGWDHNGQPVGRS